MINVNKWMLPIYTFKQPELAYPGFPAKFHDFSKITSIFPGYNIGNIGYDKSILAYQ